MKTLLFLICFLISTNSFGQQDTVRIENDSLEYEVVIIDPGFYGWLIGRARPRGFYGLEYLESNNRFYISNWNTNFFTNRRNLYLVYIDYNPNIKYGYEVNYLLFNYFQYFMEKTGERLGIRIR